MTRAARPDLTPLLRHGCPPGPHDTITDVAGVRVGHTDVRLGPAPDGAHDVATGVTAVVFDQLSGERRSLPANLAVGNGHGKLVGATQLVELGALETPIVLTSTLSTFAAADALVDWVLRRPGQAATTTLNPLVAECNDGWLSDIRARAITADHVHAALDGAQGGVPAEGAVGAGSGMVCLGYKGGIGTSSRTARLGDDAVTVGALALTNFSGDLRVGSLDLAAGAVLGAGGPDDAHGRASAATKEPHTQGNSCIVLLVTDAAVDARQLRRVAQRGVLAMGRVGAAFTHGSGDYGLAVSTAPPAPARPDHELDPLLAASLEAAEAALVRSLLEATTTRGQRGRVAHALPWSALGLER